LRDTLTGVAGAAREAADTISRTFEVSAEVRAFVLDLEKDFNKGTTAMEKFRKQLNLIEEAFVGPWRTEDRKAAAAAAVGVAGIFGNPRMDGIIAPEVKVYADFKAYEQLRQSIPRPEDRRPPVALQGSREAAEIIGRSQNKTLSVQEQMAADIRTANEIHRQNRDYQQQVAEAVDALRRQGVNVPPAVALPVR
jgi:hypothetical protein